MRLHFLYIIRKILVYHTAGRILPKKNNQSGSDLYPYGILFSHGFAAGVVVFLPDFVIARPGLLLNLQLLKQNFRYRIVISEA